MEALLEMKQQKVVRHLGITGHYRPESLIECIHRHDFDCILMAMNAADPHHYSFNEELLPLAVEKQMGIIGMKIPGRGRILSSWNPPPVEAQKHSWEGMAIQTTSPGTLTMREAMYYTLSPPRQHRHHRLRQHRPAGRERAARPRLHPAERQPGRRNW